MTLQQTICLRLDSRSKDKNEAAEKVMQSDMKFDKTSRKFVSNKLTMGLILIPDAKIMAVEEYEPDMTPNYDEIKIGQTQNGE